MASGSCSIHGGEGLGNCPLDRQLDVPGVAGEDTPVVEPGVVQGEVHGLDDRPSKDLLQDRT
eukprot:4025284-Alexandrium_andersonii.AAC.1